MNNKKIFCLISIIITISLVTTSSYHWGAIIVAYAVSSNSPEGIISIKAGSGSSTAPLTIFTPQKVEIKKGDTVRWYNPTQVGEPHTVTFVIQQNHDRLCYAFWCDKFSSIHVHTS